MRFPVYIIFFLNLYLFVRFTYAKAYRALLDELGDQAGQHEVVAENLSSQVAQELAQLVRQLKEDRRKVKSNIFLHL